MKPVISTQLESKDQYAQYTQSGTFFDADFLTSKGGRKENQDAFAVTQLSDGSWVFCVADGLGGHAGGRVASQVAVKTLIDYVQSEKFKFEDPSRLLNAFKEVNQAIVAQQQKMPEFSKMRSTLVVLCIKDSLAFWGHVGDVRLYQFRNDQVLFQTKDHSVPQMLVDTGAITSEEIRTHPDRSRLLNALGSAEKRVKVTIPQQYQQLEKGDKFHLSTDGFWEWILEQEMIDIYKSNQTMQQATLSMTDKVIKTARVKETDHDNLTALNINITEAQHNLDYWHKTQFIKNT